MFIEPECCTQCPRMLVPWEWKHSNWEHFPKAWVGQFQGKKKDATVVLEVICDPNLYIWYYFYGTRNLNILDKSSIVRLWWLAHLILTLLIHTA